MTQTTYNKTIENTTLILKKLQYYLQFAHFINRKLQFPSALVNF